MKVITLSDILTNIIIVRQKRPKQEHQLLLTAIELHFTSDGRKYFRTNECQKIIYAYRSKGRKLMVPNERDRVLHYLYDLMLKSRIKISEKQYNKEINKMEQALKPGVLEGVNPAVGGTGFFEHQKSVPVRFKKLHEDAVLPTYAKPGDAGMDCVAVSDPKDKGDYIAYDLGFAVEIPHGYVGLLFPRSSNSKKDLLLCNSVGVIDSGYRGPVQARFSKIVDVEDINGAIDDVSEAIIDMVREEDNKVNYRDIIFDGDIYHKGDKVCQLMILPYPEIKTEWADELSDTERGEGGFGHTGN